MKRTTVTIASLLFIGVAALTAVYYLATAFFAFSIWIIYFLAIGLIFEAVRLLIKLIKRWLANRRAFLMPSIGWLFYCSEKDVILWR